MSLQKGAQTSKVKEIKQGRCKSDNIFPYLQCGTLFK